MSNYLKDLEDSRLLFKTFCDGLMYGMFFYHGETLHRVVSIEGLDDTVNGAYPIKECKPCLRPMSSMTEEEKETYYNLCYENEGEAFEFGEWAARTYYHDTIDSIDYLNSIHIDYRGLIPKGLAIEVTKENNPYKE